MDQYLAEIEVIEWFRMARVRSERATMLAHARSEGEADSAQRTNSTSRKPGSEFPKVASVTPPQPHAGRSRVRFLKDLTLKQG